MDLDLRDKVVLITGSSRGIGRAIAAAFADEGAKVVITGRSGDDVDLAVTEIEQRLGPGKVLGFKGDLCREENIRLCVENVVKMWKGIDILVANIGSGDARRGWDVEEREWARMIDLNLLCAVRAVRTVIPQLIRSGGGSIVFIASIAGRACLGAPLAYESAKAALIALANSLSIAVAVHGIRVNTVAPGNILFPGSTWDDKLGSNRDATMEMVEREVALRRFGTPQEVAHAAVFLASAKSSFTTGACLVVDGGQLRGHA